MRKRYGLVNGTYWDKNNCNHWHVGGFLPKNKHSYHTNILLSIPDQKSFVQ
ncbi:MAG: hypothetical protein LBJ67_09610 [Planctomycetaceae bacterium]|nr:hypothetical protein [Planctomycetaceae bacterium]